VDVRRGSLLLLVSSCVLGLFLGSSYLGESSAQASAGQSGPVGSKVDRVIEVRQTMSDTLVDRGKEIVYGLEHAKDAVEDLIP
jgi:hypothetical protein